ncbi:MAG: T9SS type A sorting domain-containing protein [Cytophagaceae bacterium]|nr:T9SS type A sorting domain-containing protein [Cytophagaceae bacterium]
MKLSLHALILLVLVFVRTVSFSQSESPNYIPVSLKNIQKGETDILYLRFEQDATNSFDNHYDAYKLSMPTPGVSVSQVLLASVMDNNIQLSIDARPVPNTTDTIPMNLTGYNGFHTLDFSDRSSLGADYHLLLVDNYIHNIINLDQNPVYTFDIQNSNPLTFGRRFDVIFMVGSVLPVTQDIKPAIPSIQIDNVFPNPVSAGRFTIHCSGDDGDVIVAIYNALGEKVYGNIYSANGIIEVEIGENLIAGTYILGVKNEKEENRRKLVIE